MDKKVELGDLVRIENENELFEVEGYFEQLSDEFQGPRFELYLLLRGRSSKEIVEASPKDIVFMQVNQLKVDRILDKYNDYMLLGAMFNDRKYRVKAKAMLAQS